MGVFGVERFAFTLPVRSVCPGLFGGFVGLQAGPFEAVEDIFFGAGNKPALIRIFDTEDEVAAVFAGEEIVVKDGADATEMEATGGAGGKADPDSFAHKMAKVRIRR